MNENRERIRRAFTRPMPALVKVSPEGFEIDDNFFPELSGRVTKITLIRKLFEEEMPVCSSSDGVRSTDGKLCDKCRHPNCQPRLRIQLTEGGVIFIMELASSSAKNLLAMEDKALGEKAELWQWTLLLRVTNRGHWGEVSFERLTSDEPENVRSA